MQREKNQPKIERGQSMVELALAISVLMILLAGTIDLGHAFYVWLAMRDAAQEGASYGSIKPMDSSGILKRIQDNYTQVITDPSAIVSVSVTYAGAKCLSNNPSTITVVVNYQNFPITMPLLGFFIGDSIPIHATINDSIIAPKCP